MDQSCISIKGTFLQKKIFHIMLTSAEISKVRNFAIKCWRQQNFKKYFFQNDPFNGVQLWSKFHICTISQTGVIQKTSFADVSIFWFLPNIFFWAKKLIMAQQFQWSTLQCASFDVWCDMIWEVETVIKNYGKFEKCGRALKCPSFE